MNDLVQGPKKADVNVRDNERMARVCLFEPGCEGWESVSLIILASESRTYLTRYAFVVLLTRELDLAAPPGLFKPGQPINVIRTGPHAPPAVTPRGENQRPVHEGASEQCVACPWRS